MHKTTPEASLLEILNIKGLFSIGDIYSNFLKKKKGKIENRVFLFKFKILFFMFLFFQ